MTLGRCPLSFFCSRGTPPNIRWANQPWVYLPLFREWWFTLQGKVRKNGISQQVDRRRKMLTLLLRERRHVLVFIYIYYFITRAGIQTRTHCILLCPSCLFAASHPYRLIASRKALIIVSCTHSSRWRSAYASHGDRPPPSGGSLLIKQITGILLRIPFIFWDTPHGLPAKENLYTAGNACATMRSSLYTRGNYCM